MLACSGAHRVRIGRLGVLRLQSGCYVYVGSAFGAGGLRARVGHHQRIARRPHWHVDYLRRHARLETVWYESGERREHEWAARIGAMAGARTPMSGFGSSDCDCAAHLFWFEVRPPEEAMVCTLGRAAVSACGPARMSLQESIETMASTLLDELELPAGKASAGTPPLARRIIAPRVSDGRAGGCSFPKRRAGLPNGIDARVDRHANEPCQSARSYKTGPAACKKQRCHKQGVIYSHP